MAILEWAILQLSSYRPGSWVGFIVIALLAACLLGRPGIVLGHLLVAGLVVMPDPASVRAEMNRPG